MSPTETFTCCVVTRSRPYIVILCDQSRRHALIGYCGIPVSPTTGTAMNWSLPFLPGLCHPLSAMFSRAVYKPTTSQVFKKWLLRYGLCALMYCSAPPSISLCVDIYIYIYNCNCNDLIVAFLTPGDYAQNVATHCQPWLAESSIANAVIGSQEMVAVLWFVCSYI